MCVCVRKRDGGTTWEVPGGDERGGLLREGGGEGVRRRDTDGCGRRLRMASCCLRMNSFRRGPLSGKGSGGGGGYSGRGIGDKGG